MAFIRCNQKEVYQEASKAYFSSLVQLFYKASKSFVSGKDKGQLVFINFFSSFLNIVFQVKVHVLKKVVKQ